MCDVRPRPSWDPLAQVQMALKFACVPSQYAPKRKFINFALPKWRQKLAEFEHPDVASWVNTLYQSKVYPSQKEFNEAYDQAISMGALPSEVVCWRHKPMILSKDDVANFASGISPRPSARRQTPRQQTPQRN